MARLPPLAYMDDPEEEERRARLLEQEYGPPVALRNLGVMSKAEMRAADARARQQDPFDESRPAYRAALAAGDPLARGGITTADIEAAAARGEQPWPESPRPPGGTDYYEPELEEGPESALDGLLRLPAPVATNPYEGEPDPETMAADTAEERDTPPSGEEENASITPPKLSLGFNPLEELERLRATPPMDPKTAAASMSTEGGERPNLFGLEDEFGFSRDKAIARASEAYGEATPTARWEDDFLANHDRLSDAQIRRRSAALSFFGRPEHGDKFRDSERLHSAGYDKGLYEARERDRSEQRISKGLAEAIAGSGMVSPEEAVELRANDPIVKAFQSGGYSQGLRAEGQQLGMGKKYLDIIAKRMNLSDEQRADLERTLINSTTQHQVADTYASARNKLPDLTDPVAQEKELTLQGSILARSMQGVTKEQGKRIVQGDLSNLTDQQRDHVEKFLPGLLAGLGNPKVRDSILRGFTTFETQKEAKRENAVRQSIELAQGDVKHAEKWEKDWKAAAVPLSMALQAWSDMSEGSKAAFAQWSSSGFASSVGKFLTDKGDQQRAAKVRRVINALVKDRSGSAVTGSEWERIATEIGLPEGSWAPFNESDTITQHLQDSTTMLETHRADYELIMNGWKGY